MGVVRSFICLAVQWAYARQSSSHVGHGPTVWASIRPLSVSRHVLCFGSTNCNVGRPAAVKAFVFLHLLLRGCSLIRSNFSGVSGGAVLAGFASQGGQLELAIQFGMLKDGCTVINEK